MAILGLFMMLDPQQIKQSYLRLLVWAIMPSFIYDWFWIFHKHTEYWNDRSEGGMAQMILILVYFLMFYKFLMFLILWKASLNFKKFVR